MVSNKKMSVVKTKQWGHSIGVIIPAETVKEMGLKPGEEINVAVERKKNVLAELWEFGKKNPLKLKPGESVKDIIEENRREMGID